jgi:hypothetical protein
MDGFLKTKDYHVRKRLPDGRLGYRYRFIFEQAYGPIPKHFVIHHINGDENDDRIENLKLMDRHAHTLLHENYFLNKKTKASIRLGRLKGPGERVKK